MSGTSGSGTTEALLSVAVSLACSYPPDRVRLHLLDFKNAAVWGEARRLPHVATVATLFDDLAGPDALRAHVDGLLERKRSAPAPGEPVFDLIMIDEFPSSELHRLEHVERVAALGRSLDCGILLGLPSRHAAARAGPVLRYGLALGAPAVRENPLTGELPAARFASLFAAGHHPGRGVLVHAGHTIVPVQVASAGRWHRDGTVPWLDRHDLDAVVDAIVAVAGRADRDGGPS